MRLIAGNLSGERGGDSVFSGVSFSLGAGRALIVTGPNGSGKSTLLRILAGLLPKAGGTLEFERDAQGRALGQDCHYLGHQNAMKAALSVGENLLFWRDFLGGQPVDVEKALARVGLAGISHLPFGTLSTGQRRRVAIARLLLAHRPVWLLDEPTAGLDTTSEKRFAVLTKAHLTAGGIIVAATHLPLGLEEASELKMGGTVHV